MYIFFISFSCHELLRHSHQTNARKSVQARINSASHKPAKKSKKRPSNGKTPLLKTYGFLLSPPLIAVPLRVTTHSFLNSIFECSVSLPELIAPRGIYYIHKSHLAEPLELPL